MPEASIRLERPILIGQQSLHLDVWVANKGAILAIELKYKSRALKVQLCEEHFALKNQGAQDIGRYDFIKDIQRLEQIVANQETTVGYAVFLTNDSAYWVEQTQHQTVDADFRLYQGRTLEGTLQWGAGASEGTKRGREKALILHGNYMVTWHDYSTVSNERYGLFRYLVIEVMNEQGAG